MEHIQLEEKKINDVKQELQGHIGSYELLDLVNKNGKNQIY